MFAPESAETIGMREQINHLDEEVRKMHDLTSKMIEMGQGVFKVKHMPETGELEFELRGATEVKVWGGTVITQEG